MDRVGGREEKMERHCSTGQSPQWAVVPREEEEEVRRVDTLYISYFVTTIFFPHYLIKGKIFGKILLYIKRVV